MSPQRPHARSHHAAPGRAGRVSAGRPASTLVEEVRRRKRRRSLAIGLGIGAAILALAIAAGVYAYFTNTNAKLDLAPSNAADSLVAPEEGQPFFMLLSADLGMAKSAPASYGTPEHTQGYMLVRVDAAQRKLTFISIPANTLVRFANGEHHPLSDALDVGGEAELVARVAEFAGVDIAHFARTTADGIAQMVDLLGGVHMTLETEVDDPYAGTQVLFAGDSVLDGQQALVLLRAMDVPGGWDTAAADRVAFTQALLGQALSAEGLNLAAAVSDASSYIDTDLTASDLMGLADAFRPLDGASVYSAVVPGMDATTSDGRTAFDPTSKEWKAMMERVLAEGDPDTVEASVKNVDPGSVTVEVRNGTLVTGAAAQMAGMLEAAGFKVGEVGNTNDDTIYKETLVVYTDPASEGAAKAVAQAINGGRVINGGDFYHSASDVIAIVGTDWTP